MKKVLAIHWHVLTQTKEKFPVLSLSRSEKQLNNICIAHELPVLSPSRFGKETLTTFVSPVLSLSRSEKKLNNICIAHAEVEDSSCQYLCVSSH